MKNMIDDYDHLANNLARKSTQQKCNFFEIIHINICIFFDKGNFTLYKVNELEIMWQNNN